MYWWILHCTSVKQNYSIKRALHGATKFFNQRRSNDTSSMVEFHSQFAHKYPLDPVCVFINYSFKISRLSNEKRKLLRCTGFLTELSMHIARQKNSNLIWFYPPFLIFSVTWVIGVELSCVYPECRVLISIKWFFVRCLFLFRKRSFWFNWVSFIRSNFTPFLA